MTDSRPPESHSVSDQRLVAHDIRVERRVADEGKERVVATVECERRGTLCVDECRACPRFARIEVHEAGYLMLCRVHAPDAPEQARDSQPAADDAEVGTERESKASKRSPSRAV